MRPYAIQFRFKEAPEMKRGCLAPTVLALSLPRSVSLVCLWLCSTVCHTHSHTDMRIGKVLHGIDVLNETQSEQLRH